MAQMVEKKKKISPYLIITFALAAMALTIFFTAKTNTSCDTFDSLLTSVQVKALEGRNYIGLDVNRQNLTFGVLSPGAIAKKTAFAEYTKDAAASVWVEGNISPWLIISPQKFEIAPPGKQEVIFTLLVPPTAKAGEYKGKVVFCYQDK